MADGVVDRLVVEVAGRVDRSARVVDGFLGMLAKTAAGAVAGLTAVTLEAARFTDGMGKAAQRAGIGVEQMSRLAVAAELADTSVEALSRSSMAFSRNIRAAADGSARQAEAFAKIGISAQDAIASGRDFADLLPDVIDGLNRIPDPIDRAAVAQDVLGRGFRDLAPLIASGSGALREAADAAQRWGLVVSDEAHQAGMQLNDSLALLRIRARGLRLAIGTRLTPAFATLTDRIGALLDRAQPRLFELIESAFDGIASALDRIAGSPVASAIAAFAGLTAAGMTMKAVFGQQGLLSTIPKVGPAIARMASIMGVIAGPLALVVALGLAVDDLATFMDGGVSIAGRFAEAWGVEGELAMALGGARDLFQSIVGLIGDLITEGPRLASGFVDVLADKFGLLAAPIERVRDLLSGLFNMLPSFGDALRGLGFIGQANVGLIETLRSGIRGEAPGFDADAIVGGAFERMARDTQDLAVSQARQGREVTVSPVVNVDARGNLNPDEVARRVQQRLDQTIREAAAQGG